jgi:nitrite reductase (NADH) small subunit
VGFRDVFQTKLNKHGGMVGLAKHAVKKASGQAEPTPSAHDTLLAALASLPKGLDADGFQAVITSELLPEGGGNTYQRQGSPVAVFRVEGAVYALDDACPHEDGPLGEGTLKGCVVTCPYHDWHFDVTTGACTTEPDRPVATFATKEADGFVWVGAKLSEGTQTRGGDHDDGLKTYRVEAKPGAQPKN